VMGPEEFAQQIALYHQEGMGFGVLVKLYAMAEAQIEACVSQTTSSPQPTAGGVDSIQTTCEAVTIDQLVNEFRSGTGMGLLFKEYGKPALLGVGQVKKALKNLPQSTPVPTTVATTPVPTMDPANVQAQNQKSNNGNGNGNGNGNSKGHGPKK